MTPKAELQRLERIASDSLYASGVNADTVRYSFRIFERFLRGNSILEMGAAEGVMTELLAATGKTLTIVEGSKAFCDALARRFPSAQVFHSLFEDFAPDRAFADPTAILAQAATWLSAEGRILAAVPNSRSLHRQAAVLMGLLPGEEALNEMDLRHGHRRVFNPESFRQCFIAAGLMLEMFGGYWLKPLSNRQIEETWTPDLLAAFMRLGERYPDIAAEIYVVACAKPR